MKNLFRISVVILLIFLIQSCKKDKPTPPVITTTDVTAVSYTTASSGGDVTDEGGAPVVSRGVCWNTSTDPTIANSKTNETGGSGAFTSNITSLTPNTMYYVRAYATNSAGTGYGNQVSFTTSQIAIPVLTTTAITSITQATAVSGGNITDEKGGSVTARGVCWNTATNPTTANNKTTDGTGTGNFASNLTGLQPGTIYYVRSYATNSAGTSYGNEISFTTSATLPTLTTAAVSSITSTTRNKWRECYKRWRGHYYSSWSLLEHFCKSNNRIKHKNFGRWNHRTIYKFNNRVNISYDLLFKSLCDK